MTHPGHPLESPLLFDDSLNLLSVPAKECYFYKCLPMQARSFFHSGIIGRSS